MDVEPVRQFCLSLPHTTEVLQWGGIVFKVAGKVFAIVALEPGETFLSLKTTPEQFDEYVEREGFRQAPYCAKRQWIALEHAGAMRAAELREAIEQSYGLVVAKLTKKVRAELGL